MFTLRVKVNAGFRKTVWHFYLSYIASVNRNEENRGQAFKSIAEKSRLACVKKHHESITTTQKQENNKSRALNKNMRYFNIVQTKILIMSQNMSQ